MGKHTYGAVPKASKCVGKEVLVHIVGKKLKILAGCTSPNPKWSGETHDNQLKGGRDMRGIRDH